MNLGLEVRFSYGSDDMVRMEFTDKASRVRFLQVMVDPAEFAQLITSSRQVDAQASALLEKVGMQRENKSLFVPMRILNLRGWDASLREVEKYLTEDIAEGWQVFGWGDRYNQHRQQGKSYEVQLVRWVSNE